MSCPIKSGLRALFPNPWYVPPIRRQTIIYSRADRKLLVTGMQITFAVLLCFFPHSLTGTMPEVNFEENYFLTYVWFPVVYCYGNVLRF